MADPAVAHIEPVWVEADPGSVVFHHSLTVHQADANETDETRRVYCIIYFADGCIRRTPLPHLIPDRQGIAVDEPIAGELTPIVWPRPKATCPPSQRAGRLNWAFPRTSPAKASLFVMGFVGVMGVIGVIGVIGNSFASTDRVPPCESGSIPI